jgi:uncharacterized protein (TIGR04255 family)
MQAFSRFKEASGVGLPNKLSLRYINRIVIQEEPIQLDDYFRSMPIQDDSDEYLLPASVTAFFAKAEFRSPEEPFLVSNLSFATTTNEPGETGSAFFLDIDVIYNSGNIIEEGRIPTVLSMLREREYHMFEAFIKDKTREVFEQ